MQFYKLFLDARVRSRVSQYDALALIEWDMIVAHNRSFEELYRAAFGGVEPFWMKGSILEGTNFHETVMMPEQRRVLGHINGNAIYNNTDPAFVEFVNFSFQRWDYDYSYDVALWATIADFPYSWPLWQRYSRKFVTTNLVSSGKKHLVSSGTGASIVSHRIALHQTRCFIEAWMCGGYVVAVAADDMTLLNIEYRIERETRWTLNRSVERP